MDILKVLIKYIILIWIASEALIIIVKRRKSMASKKYGIKSTIIFLISLYIITFIGGKINDSGIGYIEGTVDIANTLALNLMINGIIIRWIAILTLKRQFSVNIAIVENHKVVDYGIYYYVRHPSYLGTLLTFLGLSLSSSNWISFIFMYFLILVVYIYRINLEEKMLIEYLGSEYINYSKKTKRLVPYIY